MQNLEQVGRHRDATWYRLAGDYQGEAHRWVVSTPYSIDVCNRPELCGLGFSAALRKAVVAAIGSAPFRPLLSSTPSNRLCIMNFLRGSLNFDLRHALFEAMGSNYHSTCFMSSQRSRKAGRWVVKEDMYRKMDIPPEAVLLVGDVVATGVTVKNGFRVIEDHLVARKAGLRAVIFFTIGCHKTEKLLEEIHGRFTERFEGYEETHVVYLEGKLRLVDSATRLMIAIQGTDLVKRGALLSPEYELSQYGSLAAPLERCAIYDAGSRAFDVAEYLGDVTHYWEQVRLLARRGYTLQEALKERWPEKDYQSRDHFMECKARVWPGVSTMTLEELWDAYQGRWDQKFRKWAATSAALECVCEDRLKTLENILRDAGRES